MIRSFFAHALTGMRVYGRAMLVIQGMAVLLVVGYFSSPAVQEFCLHVTEWKERGGWAFAALATIVSGGVLPELIKWKLRPASVPAPTAGELAHLLVMFAILGIAVERFYWIQDQWWGGGRDPLTLGLKILVDQCGYTLLFALPFITVWFFWKESGYQIRETWAAVRSSAFPRRVMELFAPNLSFWVPVLICLYSLPQPLQFILFLIVNTAWCLLLVFIARRQGEEVERSRALCS